MNALRDDSMPTVVQPPHRPAGVPQTMDNLSYRWHWPYLDPSGGLLGYAVRFDDSKPDGIKAIRPYFVRNGSRWLSKHAPGPRPLFGLETLAAVADDDILYIAEGEKCASLLTWMGCPCVTSSGGSRAAANSDWRPLARSRHVRIVPDNDDPGEGYAHGVTGILLKQNPALRVEVARLPGLPHAGDVVDWVQERLGDWDGYRQLKFASDDPLRVALLEAVEASAEPPSRSWTVPSDAPLPLRRHPSLPQPYPVHALGTILGDAVAAAVDVVQVAPSIAANSFLIAAAVAVQGHANVEVDGRVYPISLFALSVAKSGDRKSAIDTEAFAPHREREQQLFEQYQKDLQSHQNSLELYKQSRSKILRLSKTSSGDQRTCLDELGPPPPEPVFPAILIDDCTVEGIRRHFRTGRPSVGFCSTEGARFVGGHGMLPENMLKTLATLSNYWDGATDSTARAGEGFVYLPGRRLSQHQMMQPNVAPQLLANNNAQDQGYLWRCLMAWPESLNGKRTYREESFRDNPAYLRYCQRITLLLQMKLPLAQDSLELKPRHIHLAGSAKRCYIDFYNEIESERGEGGRWEGVASYAARISEHALRLAGVLTVVNDPNATHVKVEEMRQGIELARWYLAECLRIVEAGYTDPDLLLAETLLEWMRSRQQPVTLQSIYQKGPRAIRDAAGARRILAILQEHDWVVPDSERTNAWMTRPATGDTTDAA